MERKTSGDKRKDVKSEQNLDYLYEKLYLPF